MMKSTRMTNKGFTLIELILVIVIIGILVGVAVQNGGQLYETAKVEETKQEMNALALAIAGNPELENNGVRSDFGYIGDVGALPSNLDALYSNPGGYSTWNGPYISNRFTQTTDDYKKDAWGTNYSYSGGATITSTGSGSNIIRRVAGSEDHLLRNEVSGIMLDLDGTPPGTTEKDSVSAQLTIPNGTGSFITQITTVDAGGYFNFDSIPIGNHDLRIIYLPDNDTLSRFVSVLPNTSVSSEYRLQSDIWYDTSGGGGGTDISFVTNSDTLWTGNCSKLKFWIENNSGAPITVNSITLTWSTPTAYYKIITWNGTTVRDSTPLAASGELSNFSIAQTINDGQQLRITIESFKPNSGGSGSPVDMTGTAFTVQFSDGSTLNFTADFCN